MIELWSRPDAFTAEMEKQAQFRLMEAYARLMADAMVVVVEHDRLRRARVRLKKKAKRR